MAWPGSQPSQPGFLLVLSTLPARVALYCVRSSNPMSATPATYHDLIFGKPSLVLKRIWNAADFGEKSHPELHCQSHDNIDVDCLEGKNECVKLMGSLCHDNAKLGVTCVKRTWSLLWFDVTRQPIIWDCVLSLLHSIKRKSDWCQMLARFSGQSHAYCMSAVICWKLAPNLWDWCHLARLMQNLQHQYLDCLLNASQIRVICWSALVSLICLGAIGEGEACVRKEQECLPKNRVILDDIGRPFAQLIFVSVSHLTHWK